jgi:L-iditol 2-dehydrogenase
MKAVVKFASGEGNVEIREVEEPQCGAGQVKIEVGFCGVCGTDIHVYHDRFRNYPPVILGHEFAGTIVETGCGVERFKTGDRVTVLGAMTVVCGRCRYCRQGEFMFCPDRRGMGHGVNGAFARWVVAREAQLFRLPERLPLEQGALIEPFAAAVHAACEMTARPLGDTVLVSGPGPIGLMCVKLLAAAGVKTLVAGTTADTRRLELAGRWEAARVVDVEKEDLLSVVQEETGGQGVDVALECAGAAASVAQCLRAIRPLGRMTQVGHFGREIAIPYDLVAFRQIRITGSVGYTADSWRRALEILGSGRVELGELITQRLPLDRWQEGFQAFEARSVMKVLLQP